MPQWLSAWGRRPAARNVVFIQNRTEIHTIMTRLRSRLILSLVIGPEEFRRYMCTGKIRVTGSLGGRYELSSGYTGNIVVLGKGGRPVRNLCAHPVMFAGRRSLTFEDAMVCQILEIKENEGRFRGTALNA